MSFTEIGVKFLGLGAEVIPQFTVRVKCLGLGAEVYYNTTVLELHNKLLSISRL